MSEIVTGEAVPVDLRVARVGSRLVAAAIDLAAQFVVFWLLLFALVPLENAGVDLAVIQALFVLVVVAATMGYPIGFETLMRGRTPGKAVMGQRVVRSDGGPIRFRHALVRGLTGAFVERPGITAGLAAVLTSLFSQQGRRLGDVLAGTLVLQERVPRMDQAPVTMPPPLASWAAGLDLSRLPDGVALSARQFLGRARDFEPTAREAIGGQLARQISSYLNAEPPPGTPGWAFLAAVLAERRRREEGRLSAATAAAPTAWQPPPPSPGWGPGPGGPPWSRSAPPTGPPPPVGPPPSVPAPPAVAAPPEVGPPPQPSWGPPPTSPTRPPGRHEDTPTPGPFAVPG